jgi:hypothetical protein
MAQDRMWKTPPDVRQNYDHTCWAAVMEAFCNVSPGRPKLDQEQIYDQFKKVALPDESMDRSGMRRLLGDVRWGIAVTEPAADVFTAGPDFLSQKLGSGHVVLGYWEQKIGGWHVGLAYGISGRAVLYLNPDDKTGGLLRDDLSYFGRKGPLIVGSRKW